MKWLKFLKKYNQVQKSADGKETEIIFEKDSVAELDDEVAKSLVTLQYAEETTAPTAEDIINKSKKEITTSIIEEVKKAVGTILSDVSEEVKKNKTFAIPKDHSLEGMNGFKNQGEFWDSVIKAGRSNVVDERLIKTPSGQHTMDAEEGGFLIPEDIAQGIYEVAFLNEQSFIGSTDQRYCSGNSLKVTTGVVVNNAEATRYSGALAYWLQEADEYTSSKLTWQQLRLELNKVTALMYATEEELEDSGAALAPIMSRKAGEAIRWKINKAFVSGTGAGQPLGILNSPCLVSQAIETGQNLTTSPIFYRNIQKMYYRMPSALRSGAIWLVNPDISRLLEDLVWLDADTSIGTSATLIPAYLPAGGVVGNPYPTLKNRPVYESDFCSALGTVGDIMFVNWSAYLTLQKKGRQQIKQATSMHVRFLFDEQAFKFSARVDGQPALSSPITPINSSTTLSPFVTLAARS